jgi:hypothetical protein
MTQIEAVVTCEVVVVYENIRMCLMKHLDMKGHVSGTSR